MNADSHSLNFCFDLMSTPPVVITKSSTTKSSTVPRFRTFHTAVQKSSTILAEFLGFMARLRVDCYAVRCTVCAELDTCPMVEAGLV